MIQPFTVNQQETLRTAGQEYSRILSAAVINRNFRSKLLSDPAKAISSGFNGERFEINGKEKARLSAIQAVSLADFAAQLSQV